MASTRARTAKAVVLNTATPGTKRERLHSESSESLAEKAGKALSKPGLSRESVFGTVAKGGRHAIYAYSVLPSDPTKIVRESFDGQKTIGRVVGGSFRKLVP